MTATQPKWECPECGTQWAATAPQCPYCWMFYGRRVPNYSRNGSDDWD
jgi:hypothetical protein